MKEKINNQPNFNNLVFLKTERLIVRPVVEKDLSFIIRWKNDPDITRYLSIYLPVMEGHVQEWFQNLHKKSDEIVLVVVLKRSSKTIGAVNIRDIHWKNRTCTLGILIGDKRYHNLGYATEATTTIIDYIFNDLNLRKINGVVLEHNVNSRRYLEKVGFEKEGLRKKQYFGGGKYWDEILVALFKAEWESKQKKK